MNFILGVFDIGKKLVDIVPLFAKFLFESLSSRSPIVPEKEVDHDRTIHWLMVAIIVCFGVIVVMGMALYNAKQWESERYNENKKLEAKFKDISKEMDKINTQLLNKDSEIKTCKDSLNTVVVKCIATK